MTLRQLIERIGYQGYDSASLPEPRLKLDANENLFLPEGLVKRVLQSAASETDPRLYPGREAEELRGLIADANRVNPSVVVLGGGGDQLIGLLASTFRAGEGILSLTPTFSVYPSAARLRGIRHTECPMGSDLKMNPEALLGRVDQDTRMICVVSPHNPVGIQFEEASVRALLEGFDGPVLIDEAYVDYGRYTLAPLLDRYENLILLRTFSKAYGLAGLRVGYLLAGEGLAKALNAAQDPYPASSVSLRAAAGMLRERETVNRCVEEAKLARKRLSAGLSRVPGVEVLPTDASFVTFSPGAPAEATWRKLRGAGVALRLVKGIPGRGACLRVTVAPAVDEIPSLVEKARSEAQ